MITRILGRLIAGTTIWKVLDNLAELYTTNIIFPKSSFFGLGQSADIEILLDGRETRKFGEIKTEDGKKERWLLYYDGETVAGKVDIHVKRGGKLDHNGIKIEFIGQIYLFYDRYVHHEFVSMTRDLARPGVLMNANGFPFEFVNVEKPYESYIGINVKLRYFLRVTIAKRLSDIIREHDILVHSLAQYPDSSKSLRMEVGIEDSLHIEFEYNKSRYHLKDVIVGKIYFLLVRIKIKHMELQIIKRESSGIGQHSYMENETLAKFEIMDGAPVRGESIPIRLFLNGYDLTPTMIDINKKFSVRYYLNLVLVDEEERRYFKQQEVTLFRKSDRKRRPIAQATMSALMKQAQAMGISSGHNSYQQGASTSRISNGADLHSDPPPPPTTTTTKSLRQEHPNERGNSVRQEHSISEDSPSKIIITDSSEREEAEGEEQQASHYSEGVDTSADKISQNTAHVNNQESSAVK